MDRWISIVATVAAVAMAGRLDAQGVSTLLRGDPEATPKGTIPKAVNPFGVWVTEDGTTYVADTSTNRVRAIGPGGSTRTVAGTGRYGYVGDGGPARHAAFANPTDVAADREGSVYVADAHNHRVRKLTPWGGVITLLGNGVPGLGSPGGLGQDVSVDTPTGLFVDDARNLYVADHGNHRILRVHPDGTVAVVAGTGREGDGGDGGPAADAMLSGPTDVWVDAEGRVTIADRGNHRIRRVDLDGTIRTIAGSGVAGYEGDGLEATDARLKAPWSVAVDAQGHTYIADTGNGVVRVVDPEGYIVSVPVINEAVSAEAVPYGLFATPDGALTVADTENHTVLRLSPRAGRLSVRMSRGWTPADGVTPATVRVLSAGTGWTTRLLSGDGALQQQGDVLVVTSTRPGKVELEVAGDGGWPLRLAARYVPVRTLTAAFDRDRIIGNGDDVTVLRMRVDGRSASGEIANVRTTMPDGRVVESLVDVTGTDAVFPFNSREPGSHRFIVTVPGASPVEASLIVTAPEPWERRDRFEPNDRVDQAAEVVGAYTGTLHTPADLDYYNVPVVEGVETRLTLASTEAQAVFADLAEGKRTKDLVLGPAFGLRRGETGWRTISVSSASGRTGSYAVDTARRRIARFALPDTPDIRPNGEPNRLVIQLLDHLGELDDGDDSTRVTVTLADGDALLEARAQRLVGGRLPIVVRAFSGAHVDVRVSAEGLPPETFRLRTRQGLTLDLDPAPDDQRRLSSTVPADASFTLDLFLDAVPTNLRGVRYRVRYDAEALALAGAEPGAALARAESIVTTGDGIVDVSSVLLEGSAAADRWVGRLHFRSRGSSRGEIVVESAFAGYTDGTIEGLVVDAGVSALIEPAAALSFERLGALFGFSAGDPGFDPAYDLNLDGEIDFLDFLKFSSIAY